MSFCGNGPAVLALPSRESWQPPRMSFLVFLSHGNIPKLSKIRYFLKNNIIRSLKPIALGSNTCSKNGFFNLMIHVEKLKGSDMVALIGKTSRNLVVSLIHPSRKYIKSYSVSGFCFLTEKVGQA